MVGIKVVAQLLIKETLLVFRDVSHHMTTTTFEISLMNL